MKFSRLFLVSALLAIATLPTFSYASTTQGVSSAFDDAIFVLRADLLDSLSFELPELQDQSLDAANGVVGDEAGSSAESPVEAMLREEVTRTLQARSTSSPPVTHAVQWQHLAWGTLHARHPAGSSGFHEIELTATVDDDNDNPIFDDGLDGGRLIEGGIIDTVATSSSTARRADHASADPSASSDAGDCSSCHASIAIGGHIDSSTALQIVYSDDGTLHRQPDDPLA